MSYWMIDSSTTNKDVKRCQRCGTLLQKGQKDCQKCTKELKEKNLLRDNPKKETECPKCKSMNAIGTVVCTSCGINFIDYEQSKPLDLDVLHSIKKRKKD